MSDITFNENMKNLKWAKLVERESDFWKNYIMISSVGDIETVFGCAIRERLTTRRGMTFTHWMSPKAVWGCSLQIEKKLKANPRFVEKMNRVFAESQKKLLSNIKRLEKVNFSKITKRNLLGLYNGFCGSYKGLYAAFHLAICIDSIEYKAKQWLLKELKKNNTREKFDDYFIKLSAWPELSLLQKEELSLIKIAVKIKNKKLNRDGSLNKHVAEFAGLPVVNDETKPWDKKYFQKRLDKLANKPQGELIGELKKLHLYRSQVIKNQLILFDKLSAPEQIRNFFRLMGLSTWVRLESRSTFALSHYASRNLFNEIGRRNNLTGAEVKWLTPDETGNLITAGELPSAKKLNDRKFASVLLFRDGKYKILEGERADRFISKEVEEKLSFAKSYLIKGSVAYPGLVQGAVKLVLSQKDIKKMKKGDILVSRMTTPEIVPAARLAAAIVTDEGGITCHAAIVSRELEIPCIVGTKFATKILKDNDLVRVDANQGVVNIIKKYERKH